MKFSTYLNRRVFVMDRSKVVPLLQFHFACASEVSIVAFVLSLFVLHLSFFGSFGRLCFVIVVISGYIYWYSKTSIARTPIFIYLFLFKQC